MPEIMASGFPGKRLDPHRAGITITALMTGADVISAPDRALIVRVARAAILLFALTAGVAYLYRLYSQKFYAVTGEAKWIWAQHPISAGEPLAFFAVRDFVLPDTRYYTRLKIAGDPEYVAWLNGRRIAARGVGDVTQLDVFDLTETAPIGPNRLVIAVRAPKGVGGLIASIDLSPDSRNWFATGEEWRIYRRWSPDLLERNPPSARWEQPVIIGEPPIGRWDFLRPQWAKLADPLDRVELPQRSISFMGLVPRIRTTSGVAVAVSERTRGTAFDFGNTRGHVRLITDRPSFTSRRVEIRLTHDLEGLESIDWNPRQAVFAPGERELTLPEEHSFRYALVYGTGVRAAVVNSSAAQ
jgi:hypothetical protein